MRCLWKASFHPGIGYFLPANFWTTLCRFSEAVLSIDSRIPIIKLSVASRWFGLVQCTFSHWLTSSFTTRSDRLIEIIFLTLRWLLPGGFRERFRSGGYGIFLNGSGVNLAVNWAMIRQVVRMMDYTGIKNCITQFFVSEEVVDCWCKCGPIDYMIICEININKHEKSSRSCGAHYNKHQ